MSKDYMMITCLVPTTHVHAICSWLEDNGAREMEVRAFRNGASPPPAQKNVRGPNKPAPIFDKIKKANGKPLSTIERSEIQSEWISKHVKGDMTAKEIKELWIAAGFPKHTIYGALSRAVDNKVIKKVKPGRYRALA